MSYFSDNTLENAVVITDVTLRANCTKDTEFLTMVAE